MKETTKLWDLLVVGAGPAGIAAAINARVRRKEVLVLGAEIGSEKLRKAPHVDNYPGLPGISGEELMERFLQHARSLGAVIMEAKVDMVYPGEEFTCMTKDLQMFKARAVILATGVRQAFLLPGEKELLGRGVSYCATCDAALYKGKDVAVIGGTAEAEGEVNFLAELCNKVYYFPLYKGEVRVSPNVEVRLEKPQAILGEEKVKALSLSSGEELHVSGVFVIRDFRPVEQLVEGLKVDNGAIVVGRGMETNIPGIFAAGDCTGKPYQIGKAVGEGLTAALSAVAYLGSR
jgi:thioredoxin reductase (NADPH)